MHWQNNVLFTDKQAEAEVLPSSSSVQFKIESDLVCQRFVKFNSDKLIKVEVEVEAELGKRWE